MMNIYEKNHLGLGATVGLLSPFIGLAIVYLIFGMMTYLGIMDPAGSASGKRLRTMTLISICSNIFWIRKWNQPFTSQTLRGVIISTMLLCFGWFIAFYDTLYAE